MGSPRYQEVFRDLLANSAFFRLLVTLAKHRKEVLVKMKDGNFIRGKLISVDAYYRGFELQTNNSVLFINWRHVEYIEADKMSVKNLEAEADSLANE